MVIVIWLVPAIPKAGSYTRVAIDGVLVADAPELVRKLTLSLPSGIRSLLLLEAKNSIDPTSASPRLIPIQQHILFQNTNELCANL